MNKLFFILLVVLFTFPYNNFAQKKFVATTLMITEGLEGKKLTKQFVIHITPYTLKVTDSRETLMSYTAIDGHFGFGEEVKAYNPTTKNICYVGMHKGRLRITEGRVVLWYDGTYYY